MMMGIILYRRAAKVEVYVHAWFISVILPLEAALPHKKQQSGVGHQVLLLLWK